MSVEFGAGWGEVSPAFRNFRGTEAEKPHSWPTARPPLPEIVEGLPWTRSRVNGRNQNPETGEIIPEGLQFTVKKTEKDEHGNETERAVHHTVPMEFLSLAGKMAETYEAHQRTIMNLLRRGDRRTDSYGSLLFLENVVPTDNPDILERTFEQVKRLIEFVLDHPMDNVQHNAADADVRRFYQWNNMWYTTEDGWEGKERLVRMAIETLRLDVLSLLITYQGVYFRGLEPFDMRELDTGPEAVVEEGDIFRALNFRLKADPISYALHYHGRSGFLQPPLVYQMVKLLAESSSRRIGCPVDDFFLVKRVVSELHRPMDFIFDAWSQDLAGDIAGYQRLIDLLLRCGARRSAVSVFVFDFEDLYSEKNYREYRNAVYWDWSSFTFQGLVTNVKAWQDTNIPARVALWFQQEPRDTADNEPLPNSTYATGKLYTEIFVAGYLPQVFDTEQAIAQMTTMTTDQKREMLTWFYRAFAPLSYFRAYSVLDAHVTTRTVGLALACGLLDACSEETQLWVCHKYGTEVDLMKGDLEVADKKLSAVLRTLFEHAYRANGDQRVQLTPFFCAWVFLCERIFPSGRFQHLYRQREPAENVLGVLRDYTDFFQKQDNLVYLLNSFYAHEYPVVLAHFTELFFAPGNEATRELRNWFVIEAVKEHLPNDGLFNINPAIDNAWPHAPLETAAQVLERQRVSHELLVALDARLGSATGQPPQP